MTAVPRPSSLTLRAAAAILGGVLAASLLVGCSDAGGSGDDEPEVDTSSEPTEPTEPTEPSGTPTGYLPVPEGVTLTEPGAALGFGDTATVAWRPRQDMVVALDLTVDRIDRTSYAESFEGWVVTPQMKGQVPYFVRATAKNVGDAPVGGLLVPVYGITDGTSLYEPLSFREEVFEPCPGGELPEKVKPGKSVDLCFVYLLPEGEGLTAAAFDLVGELDPVTWTGEITAIEKPEKDDKGKKGKKGTKGDDEKTDESQE